MSAEKTHVAIVGLGLGRVYVAACAEHEAVERLAVCDPDERRVEEIRRETRQVTAGYHDLAELLDAERPAAVCVVTPDHLHRKHAVQCLEAGCHVLLTKPIATNLDDARAIIQAADEAGRILMIAQERRFRRMVMAVKDLLVERRLGEIIHLRIDTIQDKRRQFARSPWYASDEAGRSAIVGTGIHEVDLLRHYVGEPIVSVIAASNRLGTLEFPAAKTTSAVFQFEGGAIGQVTVSYEPHWPKAGAIDDHFRLIGSKGLIVGTRYAIDGEDDWQELPTEGSDIRAGVRGCVNAFLNSVTTGAPVAITGRDAYDSLAACTAADIAADTESAVRPQTITKS